MLQFCKFNMRIKIRMKVSKSCSWNEAHVLLFYNYLELHWEYTLQVYFLIHGAYTHQNWISVDVSHHFPVYFIPFSNSLGALILTSAKFFVPHVGSFSQAGYIHFHSHLDTAVVSMGRLTEQVKNHASIKAQPSSPDQGSWWHTHWIFIGVNFMMVLQVYHSKFAFMI